MNALDRLPIQARSPLPPYTQGWYCVADTHEVEINKMMPVTFLGSQFVVYRTPDGVAHVADAFCPHLGAHVASHDGKMENGEIVCPFHKWRFSGETGLCNSVPYSEAPAGKVGLTVYPTKEILGMVLMYFDPMGRPPESLPTFDTNIMSEGKWIKYVEKKWIMHAHPQEFLENIFDPAHLTQLHSGTIIPRYDFINDTDYGLHLRLLYDQVDGYPVESIDVFYGALSYSILQFRGTGFEVVPVVNFTPIDEERTLQHVRLYVRDTGNPEMNEMVGGAFSNQFILEVEQDLKVLDYKKHIVNPKLCLGDGPIYQFRRYAKKFYPETV